MARKNRWSAAVGLFGLAVVGTLALVSSFASAKPPQPPSCPQCQPICQNGLRCVVSACGSDCVYTCWFDPTCH